MSTTWAPPPSSADAVACGLQSRVDGTLLLDPSHEEMLKDDGSLLLALMPTRNMVRSHSCLLVLWEEGGEGDMHAGRSRGSSSLAAPGVQRFPREAGSLYQLVSADMQTSGTASDCRCLLEQLPNPAAV